MNHVIGHVMVAILHWLAVVTGTYIPPGQYSEFYNFWSGFGSDLMYAGVIIGLIHAWLNSRCHHGGTGLHGCRRHGAFPFHHYKLCKVHHPNVHGDLTSEHIRKLNKKSVKL